MNRWLVDRNIWAHLFDFLVIFAVVAVIGLCHLPITAD